MSTFFQQGLQQGINLYNQAAQRARQAELDAIDKTRIEVLNKATEMQIKQAESAMELGNLKTAQYKREMEETERQRVYAEAVDKFWSAKKFDHTAENANAELDAIILNPPEGVPINNKYWRDTIQNERGKIDAAKEVQYTNKAIDIVSKLKTDVDSVFGMGGDLSTEEANSMLSRLSSAMANPYVMKTPFAAKSIANIATILSSHVSREFQQQGMLNERIGKLGSEISNTARQLNEALADSLDPGLAEELRGHLSLLISERQKLMGVSVSVPEPEPEPDTETPSVKRYNLSEVSREWISKQDSKRAAKDRTTNAPRLNIPNARTTRTIPRMSTGLKSAEGALMLQTGGTIDKINQILGMSIGPNGRPLINKF